MKYLKMMILLIIFIFVIFFIKQDDNPYKYSKGAVYIGNKKYLDSLHVNQNDVLVEDIECNSPSTAGWVPLGKANNGWIVWKTADGKPINTFRSAIPE